MIGAIGGGEGVSEPFDAPVPVGCLGPAACRAKRCRPTGMSSTVRPADGSFSRAPVEAESEVPVGSRARKPGGDGRLHWTPTEADRVPGPGGVRRPGCGTIGAPADGLPGLNRAGRGVFVLPKGVNLGLLFGPMSGSIPPLG